PSNATPIVTAPNNHSEKTGPQRNQRSLESGQVQFEGISAQPNIARTKTPESPIQSGSSRKFQAPVSHCQDALERFPHHRSENVLFSRLEYLLSILSHGEPLLAPV